MVPEGLQNRESRVPYAQNLVVHPSHLFLLSALPIGDYPLAQRVPTTWLSVYHHLAQSALVEHHDGVKDSPGV